MNKVIFTFTVLLFTIDLNSQPGWFPLTSGTGLNLFCVTFTSENTGYTSGAYELILKTTNAGTNWFQVHSGANRDFLSMSFPNELTGYAGGGNPSGSPVILKTTNAGLNWSNVTPVISSSLLTITFSSVTTGFAGTEFGIILKTTDGGTTWDTVNNGGITDVIAALTFIDSQTGYGVTGDTTQIIKTIDGGDNWSVLNTGLTGEYYFWSIKFLNINTGYAIDYQGKIIKTTNGGINWTEQQSTTTNTLRSISIINENTAYICGNNGLTIKTTNGGSNWSQQQSGTTNWLMSNYFTNENTGYIAGLGGVIRKTTNGGNPIGIKKIGSEIPKSFGLKQNYPNPFNPATYLKFEISELRFVKLLIYDVLGREVAALINEQLKPGIYEIEWDGSTFSSGIYFYKLNAEGYSDTKRMALIK